MQNIQYGRLFFVLGAYYWKKHTIKDFRMVTSKEKKRYNLHLNKEDADSIRNFLKEHNSTLSEYINILFSKIVTDIKDDFRIQKNEPISLEHYKNILRINDDINFEKIDLETINVLDKLAQKTDISRNKLVNNLLKMTSKELLLSGKVGILQFGLLIRDMRDALILWATRVKKNKNMTEWEDKANKDKYFK